MNIDSLRELTYPSISIEIDDAVLILKFGEDAYDFLTDLDKRNRYFQMMDAVENDEDIKVILTLCEPDSLNEDAYVRFLRRICGTDIALEDIGSSWEFKENTDRIKQLRFHRYAIERRVASKKIIIDGLRGTIVTPFFGETLTADLRYASDGMCFSLAHKKYGLHPAGALAFFLPKYIGQGRAVELMLTADYIDAKQAHELGLINRILPAVDFESQCIELAKEVSRVSMETLTSTKLLLTSYKKELDNYFEAEETLIHNW